MLEEQFFIDETLLDTVGVLCTPTVSNKIESTFLLSKETTRAFPASSSIRAPPHTYFKMADAKSTPEAVAAAEAAAAEGAALISSPAPAVGGAGAAAAADPIVKRKAGPRARRAGSIAASSVGSVSRRSNRSRAKAFRIQVECNLETVYLRLCRKAIMNGTANLAAIDGDFCRLIVTDDQYDLFKDVPASSFATCKGRQTLIKLTLNMIGKGMYALFRDRVNRVITKK